MSKKYCIAIEEDHLPLITHLNDGVTPLIEEERTYFLFTVKDDHTIDDEDIKSEDDLYDDKGHALDIERKFLF